MENPLSFEHQYAGFWRRLLAQIIDAIILGVLGYLLFGSAVTNVTGADGLYSVNVSFTNWQTLIPVLYTILFWIWKGATPGKMVLGMKIINVDGSDLTWGRAIGRYFAYFVSAIVIFIGFIWIGFDSKKQGWHDKLAGTYVVMK